MIVNTLVQLPDVFNLFFPAHGSVDTELLDVQLPDGRQYHLCSIQYPTELNGGFILTFIPKDEQ